MWAHSKKAATFKLGEEASPEPDHADTLILDSQPPGYEKMKSLLFKPPSLWCFAKT